MGTELYRKSKGYKIFGIVNAVVLIIFCALCLYPFLYTLALSFSSREFVETGSIALLPKGFNLAAYVRAFEEPGFIRGLFNSVFYTVAGAFISVTVSSMLAFALTNKEVKGRNVFLLMVIITMFFSGGIIPNFLLLKQLNLINKMWSLILPVAINPFFFLVIYSNMMSIPTEMKEAAMIDGLSPFKIFYKIYLPLCQATIATVTLFTSLFMWNNWFTASIYLFDRDKFPVMLVLRNMIVGGNTTSEDIIDTLTVSSQSLTSAATVVVAIPIVILYMLLSKYFEKGLTLGGVKG
ncbi:carbohydrate ABC transporter permease [Vallitalea pronyensis]|uniref:Carbohydrate ABC transporter permease n=1 Tax=Vallitalea pronyensis TaxID=1348613 RepID=A0A8J8MI30_9FIRM|nr:carbohydrate ABC transporter permease [Vallitalea pronyensis]QUI21623.1 carbohydrate ABC transporter permease [Vallitalea pronyensis]